MRGVVLLLAAGEGSRLKAVEPKCLFDLGGAPIIRYSFDAASNADLVDAIVVAAPAEHVRRIESLLPPASKPVVVVDGGASRQASAAAALAAAPDDSQAFLVHDAARPLVESSLFDACLRELDECEAVCPAVPLVDTIKETHSDHIVRTLDRSHLVAVQTPQGFQAGVYRRAHEMASREEFEGTDDAALVERLGVRVRIIPGDDRNMKITTIHDVAIASVLMTASR